MGSTPDASQNDQTPAQPFDELHFDIFPMWEAVGGMLAVGLLYAALPARLIIGPGWLLIVLEVIVLLPVAVTLLTHRGLSFKVIRIFLLLLLCILTLTLALSIILLVATLSSDKYPMYLLQAAALLWVSNIIVFGLWYWQVDGGGPLKRHLSRHRAADFMFPQQTDGNTKGWVPHFLDYLFLAFTGATALSPADTYPLTRPAKVLMMIEAVISMAIIVLLAARAVNILGSQVVVVYLGFYPIERKALGFSRRDTSESLFGSGTYNLEPDE